MAEKNTYIIYTGALFQALNNNRKNDDLTEIENSLIASKVGILFALKTNGYVNFKDELVELDDDQLIALREIFEQHFNVDMTREIYSMLETPEPSLANQTATAAKKNFFGKIKGLFKIRANVQENPA